jgi:CBS domain-containing protein
LSNLLNFLSGIHPFELLSESELEETLSHIDIGYYKRGETLISIDSSPEKLYMILKGRVLEFEEEKVVSIYNERESLDAKSILDGVSKNRFVVDEELLCYELSKEKFLKLLQTHQSFKNYYMESFVKKIGSIRKGGALSLFMVAKVSNIFLHSVTFAKPDESLQSAVKRKESEKSSAILVEGSEISIVTDTNIRKSLVLEEQPLSTPVGEIGIKPVQTIDFEDFLFNALLLITKHQIKRLVVLKEGKIVGILEQMDILSYFSNHSHLVMVEIEKASSVEELLSISNRFISLIRTLHEKDVKVRHSAKLINELNIKIYFKLANLIFPKELHSQISLFVMGSEGRREQILKTDQDNGIILKNSLIRDEVLKYAKLFSSKLLEMGYPECDGNIMVSNPYWVDSLENFKIRILEFFENPTPQALLELSIIFDGETVFGDEKPLLELKEHLLNKLQDFQFVRDSLAKASLSFETPLSFFKNFILDSKHDNELDIKKGGIFPIVHGVRILAMEKRIFQTNTVERIKELNNLEVFNREFASELMEAFDTLLTLRLKARLQKIDDEKELDNYLNPNDISSFERVLLKDSFRIVERFKKFITHHFSLDRIS